MELASLVGPVIIGMSIVLNGIIIAKAIKHQTSVLFTLEGETSIAKDHIDEEYYSCTNKI